VFYPHQFPDDLRPLVELARAKAEAAYAAKVGAFGRSEELLIDFMIAPITVAFGLAANQAVRQGTMNIEELAETVEQFCSSLTSDLSGISYNPFSEDEESRNRKAKFEEKCAERLTRNPGWIRHLNARVALRKAHARRPARSLAKPAGESALPQQESGRRRPAKPDARSRRQRIDDFKRRVAAETDLRPADIDLILVAGYQKNSRNLLMRFLKGTAGPKTFEAFERVLSMSTSDFRRDVERKRSRPK
jgi:hypothetical protein